MKAQVILMACAATLAVTVVWPLRVPISDYVTCNILNLCSEDGPDAKWLTADGREIDR